MYGNECDTEGLLHLSDITVSTAPQTPIETSLEDVGSGRYRLKVKLQQSGTYEIGIKVKREVVPIAFLDLVTEEDEAQIVEVGHRDTVSAHVYPGILDPKHCLVQVPADSCIAGDTVLVQIALRDKYDNPTWHKPYPISIKALCAEESLPVVLSDSLDFTSVTCSMVPITAGAMRLMVTYNEFPLVDMTVSVNPGPAHIPSCSVEGAGLYGCTVLKGEPLLRFSVLTLCDFLGNPTASSRINYEVSNSSGTRIRTEVEEIALGRYRLIYQLTAADQYQVSCAVDGQTLPNFPVKVMVWRDKKEVQEELQQLRERELKQQEEMRRKEEEERRKKLEEDQKAQERAEELRQRELERKRLQEEKQLASQKQKEEDLEMEKRKRVIEKIKKYQETQKRAQEALRALESAHKKERAPQTFKRIGGGFRVPFETQN